jgi:hypothetical protein
MFRCDVRNIWQIATRYVQATDKYKIRFYDYNKFVIRTNYVNGKFPISSFASFKNSLSLGKDFDRE